MKQITITKLNETFMRVQCVEEHMEMELRDRFSFEAVNAKFDPRVKSGKWDGIKRMYNRRTKRMPVGLLEDVIKWCIKQEYTFQVDPNLIPQSKISRQEVEDIIREVIKPHVDGKQVMPREHQLDGICHMLNHNRSLVLSATSSGKSMIIYCALRIYQLLDEMDGKTMFLIVPSKGLVEQMYSDFRDYSHNGEGTSWHVETHCQRISQKYEKYVNKQIVITTWQSLNKMPKWLINSAGAIFVDEVHKASAGVLTNMIESATGCGIRHGLTATFHDMECHVMSVKGLFGPLKKVMSARNLIDQGYATEALVNVVFLHYTDDEKVGYLEWIKDAKKKAHPKAKKTAAYNAELEYLYLNPNRFKFVQNLVKTLKGNTLVLFDRVEVYGKPLYEDALKKGYDAYLITGEIDADNRERIRNLVEDKDGCVIYASVGTMSTGVSIKNLHNLVNASSTKSKITILQSIGRMMRKHSSKDKALIFDIVDNLTYEGKSNMTYNHIKDRLKHYMRERFKLKIHDHYFK